MIKRSPSWKFPWGVLVLLAVVLFFPGRSTASQEDTGEPEVKVKQVEVKLLDLELIDQDGKKVRFRSDVVGDRIAVIDTFFTSCGLICPVLSAIFADVQEQLGERLGKDVVLVSISVDPNTDIPLRLTEHAGRFDAKPGWIFLTGNKQNVDLVLQGIDAYTQDFTEHPAMILVGDGGAGGWTRFYGFASPERIMGRIDELLGRRQARTR
jgi:protein SCO1/2